MAESPQLFIALYTDEHISRRLAPALRERNYDAVSSQEAETGGWSDERHLAYAAEHHMALLTADTRYATLAESWANAGREFRGIIITPEFDMDHFGTLLKWTLNLLDKLTADELHNAVVFLQQFQNAEK